VDQPLTVKGAAPQVTEWVPDTPQLVVLQSAALTNGEKQHMAVTRTFRKASNEYGFEVFMSITLFTEYRATSDQNILSIAKSKYCAN
jgi:hypothetical protein